MTSTALIVWALGVALGGQALRRNKIERTAASSLPARAVDPETDAEGGWWAQDAVQTYLPPQATSQLSQDITDYYYALGPKTALSEEHVKYRVGGKGMVHIFHLPNGTSALEQVTEDEVSPKRRDTSLSEMRSLSVGARLGGFPVLQVPSSYNDPLNGVALAAEKQAMSRMTKASYANYLTKFTSSASTRNTDNKAATRDVVAYLEREFKSTGVTTCIHKWMVGSRQIHNVIGLVKGTSSGSVTIGAHFDNLPSRGDAPGAEDDGSGIAGVLASMKAMRGAGIKPRKSIYFVAFGGEEQNLYGSDRFAAELKRPGGSNSPIPSACRVGRSSDHTAFTMDMIGYRNPNFSADTVLVETRNQYKVLGVHLAKSNQVNNAGALKVTFSNDPFGSDHMSFIQRGLPATLSIDNDGDTDKYSCYHRSCDSTRNINTRFANNIARMNLGAALRVAGM